VASGGEHRPVSRRAARTRGFAAPAFAGCACVVGLATLSYRLGQGLSSDRRAGPIRLSSGHGRPAGASAGEAGEWRGSAPPGAKPGAFRARRAWPGTSRSVDRPRVVVPCALCASVVNRCAMLPEERWAACGGWAVGAAPLSRVDRAAGSPQRRRGRGERKRRGGWGAPQPHHPFSLLHLLISAKSSTRGGSGPLFSAFSAPLW
jgi:hypothetical protein